MGFFRSLISELESLGLEAPNLNELNDTNEVENLVKNLKQRTFYGLQIHVCIHRLRVWFNVKAVVLNFLKFSVHLCIFLI